MDRTPKHTARNRRRHAALLAGCALGLVLAATPEAALAQDANKGFQGVGTVDAGGASIFTPDGGKFTGIDVGTPTAVITWKPDDQSTSGTIDFLPAGYSATFASSTQTDYTVLNRILPGGTATIGINGTITSSVANGRIQSPGGNVWFYTPNGFVIGPKAVIQVGGLVMTTNDITYSIDPASALPNFADANGAINFRGPDGSKGSIVNNGSIIGNNANSYIALVAPRIEQHGYVSADRSIAYIAGEQVDLKINAGNFDIVIGGGTTDENGIVHDGTTTGAASTGYLDQKAIQFVAVPKNTALTMLLSGSVGYTPATSIYDDGGAIVLTAGQDEAPDGNIAIGATDFRSRVNAHATGDLTVAPPSPGPFDEGTSNTTFESFASLSGDKSVHLTAAGGTRIEAFNGLSVYSQSATGGGAIAIDALSGEGLAPFGVISVAGGMTADASHYGDTSEDGTTGLDAHGGSVSVHADGGQINADYMYLYAGGYGGFGSKKGGDGYAGTIDVGAGFGGSIRSDYVSLNARGDGGGSYDYSNDIPIGGQGGVGHGGSITLADSRGTLEEDPTGGLLNVSSLELDTSAVGGNSYNPFSGMGGDAFGGTIDITFDRQNQSINYLYAYARAEDGDSGAQDPLGGTITMTVGGGTAVNLDYLNLDAGIRASVNSPAGAFGTGGTVGVTVNGGASLTVSGAASLNAEAEVSSSYYGTNDTSPDVTGGTVSLVADNGRFQANNIYLDASAYNVGGESGAGFARGGTATVRAANGGSIATVSNPESEGDGYLSVDVQGYGTGGTFANTVTGGDITLAAETGGTIAAGSGYIDLYAAGTYGFAQGGQASGVTAYGGKIAIDAIGGTIASAIYADASGQGGDADNFAGSGAGGSIDVRVLGGTLVNSLYANTEGYGGFTYIEGDGGDGTGGRFTLTSDAGATFTNFGLNYDGSGQGGATYLGAGGDGRGGSAQIDVIGGAHDWYNIYLDGSGRGASSYGEGSLAGSVYGSEDGLNVHVGGGAQMTLSYLDLNARASAGGDGNANEASGGTAKLLVDQLATLTADSISIDATGRMEFEERDPTGYATTPDAAGGIGSVVADGGTITTPYLEVVANGMTGGALTAAGVASGGIAEIGSSAGGLIDIVGGVEGSGGLTLEARGLGAEGPSAADAFGGIATLYTAGGSISSVFDITVNANGEAGDFANYFASSGSANGYQANGGIASVEMRTGGVGGTINAPSITVTADGLANQIGSVLGAGGTGRGGIASLDMEQGTLTTGEISISGDGIGGQANERFDDGAAFASGGGEGGIADFNLYGGTVHTTSVAVSANGAGAAGFRGMSGATGSLPGAGAGGIAGFTASGGTLDDTGGLVVEAHGSGGVGADNPDVGAGGDGGDGNGGVSSFAASGAASLGIASSIRIAADGLGGSAGNSLDGTLGVGGNGGGGVATMTLADIAFAFGRVDVSATGVGGFGSTDGIGSGGVSTFRLDDSSPATSVTPRTIDNLFLGAAGFDARENPSVGGQASFVADANGPDAALTITNDLSLYADGLSGPTGLGAVIDISGTPVTVGGALEVITPRSALFTIGSGSALNVNGDLDVLVGRALNSTGAISTAANARVIANSGITMTDLSVGGTTLLQAINGPVFISNDLRSTGPVTVLGRSVSIVSFGGLSFADANATAGDLSIEAAGDLLLATVDATGAVTLVSNGGSIHNTGAVNGVGISYIAAGNVQSDTVLASGGALSVDAGGTFNAPGTVSAVGNVSLSADLGMALAGVVSGGTTLLQASDGSLSVDSLTSPGLVTAEARSLTIGSPGALRFARAQATAGNLSLTTAGNLVVTQGGASGAVSLTSTGGRITGAGPIASGGDTTISSNGDIALGTLTSGGATSLTTAIGAVGVTDLNSAGAVTASGRAVTIGSSGALTFADLDASAGDIAVQTAGDLTVNTVDATGSIALTSTGGALDANGALNGDGITLSSLADLQLASGVSTPGAVSLTSTGGSVTASAPITSGGNLAVSGNSGIALGIASSGGTTSLTATNGAVSVTDLNSIGAVTALGQAVDIASSGALSFAGLDATAGDVRIESVDDLAVATVDATGAVSLTSTGGSVTASAPITSGGNLAVSGNSGIALGIATSGGATSLSAENGAVSVIDLNSAGAVTALGQALDIGSSGALDFASAQATAGDLYLQTWGNLSLAQASAAGALTLLSYGGNVSGAGSISAGGNADVSGASGVTLASLASGGATNLNSSGGAISVANLNSAGAVSASGRSIAIGSNGALSFADLEGAAGGVSVQTAGDLAVGLVHATGAISLASTGGALTANGSIDGSAIALSSFADLDLADGININAPGAIELTSTSGSVTGLAPVAAGGNLTVSGSTGIALREVSSGGTTTLSAENGVVSVSDLSSAGAVTALGRSLDITSGGALTFADAQATAGDLSVVTDNDLSLAHASATGAISFASTSGAVTSSGAIVSGGDTSVSGNAGVSLASLTSGGTTALTSDSGAVAVTNLSSSGQVNALGRSVTIGSDGALSFADLDATAGNVAVQAAGDLSVATVDATGSISLVSTGGALDVSGALDGDGITLSSLTSLALASGVTTPGAISLTSTSGSVTASGPVNAGDTLSVSGNSGIALATATSGAATDLTAANGAIAVADLNSAGAVSASGRSIDIASTGALSFTDARATAGALRLATAGNLAVTRGSATGALALTSSAGSVRSAETLVSGGNASISARQGVTLASLTSGGATALTSTNGAVAVDSLTSASNVTASGRSVSIASPGALRFTNAQATAGDLTLATAGNLSVAQAGATAALRLSSANGSVTGTGPITSGGNASVSGESGVTLAALSSGGATSLASANGAVAVTALDSAGAVTATGRAVTIGSGGALAFADLDATGGSIDVETAGDLAVDTVDATGSISLTSTGGGLQTSGAINGDGITLSSLASLQTSGLSTVGAVSLTSTSGSVSATGPVSAGGDVTASGQTGVFFGHLSSGGTTTLTAPNGAIGVEALGSAGAVTASGRSVDLRGPGSLSVSNARATAGDLVLQAGDDLTVANASASGIAALSAGGNLVTSGPVNAAGISLDATNVTVGGQVQSTAGLDVFADQLFTLNGLATGTGIEVNSGDIEIGSTGRLGSRGLTQSIALRNRDASEPMNIGGAAVEGQYSLDKDEAARLFADQQISFIAQAGEGDGGDVNIGELALAFGDNANIGSGGLLKVDAGGVVEVNGAVTLTTVSDDDRFSIDPSRINVIAGEGAIVMRDAAGDLQGTLELQADTIGVADRATLDKIASLTDFGAISAALGDPGPAGPQSGYLQAGTINLIVGDSLFIQNGGATTAYDDRRGFLANTLNIESESSNPQIAINGVIRSPSGDLIGLDTSGAVSINGTFAADLPSSVTVTVNGCNSGVDCGRPDFSYNGLSSDDLELVVTTADEGKNGPTGQLVQVQDNRPLITPPLVDEPITGVGNDDLWQVKCTPEGDKGSCPAEEGTE